MGIDNIKFSIMYLYEDSKERGERFVLPTKELFESLPDSFDFSDESTYYSIKTEKAKEIEQRIFVLFDEIKKTLPEVIDKEDRINLDTNSIRVGVGELQNYSLITCERDVIADAFETFIGHALKGGQGQFFTPRNVVKMAVDILQPTENDRIIDPACGSGGFLIESLKFMWEQIDKKYQKLGWGKSDIDRRKIDAATKNFRGIDKDYFLSKVAKTYMNLMGDGTTGIFFEDSLEKPENWHNETQSKIKLGSFDILLTNPPFGSKIPVVGEEKLSQFDVAHKWKFDKKLEKWEKTEKIKEQEELQVLFIERCLSFLKDGGKMAMVLPSGILGNEQEEYLRQYMLSKGNLFAIIELPPETFSPHITINTNVLFIQKGAVNKKDIFISINEHCGHDKKGRPTPHDDISSVSLSYNKHKVNTNNFFIKPTQLESSFVAKRYLKKYLSNLEKIESSRYDVVSFGDIITSIHNGANIDDASIYVEKEHGIPYILVKSITKEGINFENLKYIRKDLNVYYIVAFMNSEYGQMQLERISSGSILQSIRSSDLRKIKIILPPKDIQNTIGDKIKEAVYSAAFLRGKIQEVNENILGLV